MTCWSRLLTILALLLLPILPLRPAGAEGKRIPIVMQLPGMR